MALAHQDALEIRSRCTKIEQEGGRRVASEGARAEQEPAAAPKGVALLLEEVADEDQGFNPEIKPSDEVLADERLRAEAKSRLGRSRRHRG